jgi:hypothetical protein
MLTTSSTNSTFINGDNIPSMSRNATLTAGAVIKSQPFLQRRRPIYIGMGQIMDISWGAAGDGATDDTAVLNSTLDQADNMSSIVFVPFGVYVITDTLHVPIGLRNIGQVWSYFDGP